MQKETVKIINNKIKIKIALSTTCDTYLLITESSLIRKPSNVISYFIISMI